MAEQYPGTIQDLRSENAPIKSPMDSAGARDDADQQDLQMVMSLWEMSKKARSRYDQNWGKYQNYYDGKQWPKKLPSYKSAPNINIIRSTIETEIPLLTDTSPGFDVTAKNPMDFQFAETLSKAIHDWWDRNGGDLIVSQWIKDSFITDVGIIKIVWDEEAEAGFGDIAVKLINPDNLWVSPNATDFKDTDWVVERFYKTVGELKMLFPEYADKIKSTGGDSKKKDDQQAKAESGDVVLVSPIDRKSNIKDMKDVSGSNLSDYNTLEVIEAWIRDYAIEEYDITNEKGEASKGQKMKFPGGKLVTIIPSQKIVLQSKPNPYRDRHFPYVRTVDNVRPREFYGQGEVEPLIETQDLLNIVTARIVDYVNIMSNPTWIKDDDSGVDDDMLTNQIGLIITKRRGSEVRREQAPPLPPQLFEMYNMLQSLADQQSGVNDVTQGRKPTGITAAEALQTMQEAAQTRVRLKERNLTCALNNFGELMISRMMQYYKTPRVVRMAGGETVWPAYFEFYIEDKGDGTVGLNKREYQYNPETQGYDAGQYQQVGQPTLGLFSVNVKGGTSLPFLKEKRGDLAMNLFKMGAIDQPDLLKKLDWGEKEQVMRRMQEAAAQQQQVAQMQQAQQAQQQRPQPPAA